MGRRQLTALEARRELIVRALAWTGAGIAGAVLLCAVSLFTLNLSFILRHPIEEALSRAAGRQVFVNGKVRLIPVRGLTLRLGNVFVANMAEPTHPELVLARRVDAHLLISGFPRTRLIVRSIDADGIKVTLDRSARGMRWMLPGKGTADRGIIKVRLVPFPVQLAPQSLVATSISFATRLPWQAEMQTYAVDRLTAQSGGPLGAYIALVGHRGTDTWRADADISSLEALLAGATFRVKGRASGLGARLAFDGSLALDAANPSDLSGIGEAADTQRLWSVVADAKPTPASFTFSLRNIQQAETLLVHFKQLGTGDLDIGLGFTGPARDRIAGRISAKTLDLAALPRAFGNAQSKTIFSNKPLAVAALSKSQIDIKLDAESINWRDTPIGRLAFGIYAGNGIVAAGPLALDGPQAHATGDATLDLRAAPKLTLSLKADLANLGALLGSAENAAPAVRADLAFELVGAGQSPAQIMATAFGQADVLIGPGDVGGTLASALPIEIAYGLKKDHSLAPLPNADRPLGLKCLVGRFDIADGKAQSRALFVDTSAATTTGAGAVNFADESLDFHLAPRPKDPDLIGEARDIDLRGTLRNPVFAPQDAAIKGLSRMASETALAPTFDVIMPLLGPDAVLANPCVRSLMSESALASLRQERQSAAMSGRRAEAP